MFRYGVVLLFLFLNARMVFGQGTTPLDKSLSFAVSDKKPAEVLKLIQSKTRVHFNYKTGILPVTPIPFFSAQDEKLSEILTRLLKPYQIEYKYFGGNSIVLKPIKKPGDHLFTLSGYVFDQSNGEKLVGATIYCNNLKKGVTTNDYGFFTLSLPEDSMQLEIRFVGYKTYRESRYLGNNSFRIYNLEPKTNLREVEINDESRAKSGQKPNGFFFNQKAIKDIPAFMGEPDIIRAAQLLPGIQGVGESSGGLNVRGGGTDQNLVLLDGVPVYNIVHLFGLFSIINPGAVQSLEIVKGGFPAKYNGRLSSIFDIRLKDGNNQKLSGSLSLGLLMSSLTLQGPLIKNKSSFIVSFRRTYFDLLYRPVKFLSSRDELNNYTGWFYFYDVNAKANYKIGNRNKISLNVFSGTDRGRITEKQSFNDSTELLDSRRHNKNIRWQTFMSSARWDHILNDKVFMVVTAGITQYSTRFEDELIWETKPKPESVYSSVRYKQTSGNSDLFLKTLFEINKFKDHDLNAGADLIYHRFNTGTLSYLSVENTQEKDTTIGNRNIFSNEALVYLEDNWRVTRKLQLNPGLSFNAITVNNKTYSLLQPRINGTYHLSHNLYVGASYSKMQQNLQILPNNSIGLPVDVWIPVTTNLKPQISDQYTAGLGYHIKQGIKFSAEAYYKKMHNLVELKEGDFFIFGGYEWDKSFYTGTGNAKGLEIMMERNQGKLQGWVGYALSKSDRRFSEINNGSSFPFKYDRRHQITLFLKTPINKHWQLAGSWVYSSGSPVTIPTSAYTLNNKTYYQFTERNNIRMSDYHRMDISFTKTLIFQKSRRVWNFGAYNVYSHINPMFISSSYIVNSSNSRLRFYEVGLLPLIPFLSYEISF